MSVLDSMQLNGDSAFVTGASRGLGRASALALAEMGADLALGATNEKMLEETAEAVRATACVSRKGPSKTSKARSKGSTKQTAA